MRYEELELEDVVDRVGLGVYPERVYVEINASDKEKVQKLLEKDNIPNGIVDNAIALFAKEETEIRMLTEFIDHEDLTKIDSEKFFKIRDDVSKKISNLMYEHDGGLINREAIEKETKKLLEEYKNDNSNVNG